MTTPFPLQLDPFKAAEQQFKWSGQFALSRLQRLSLDALNDIQQQFVSLTCQLSKDPYYARIIWLDATVHTVVELECQRCLEPVQLNLDTQVHLAILNDESMIEHLEDEIDFVVLGENDSSQKGDFLTTATVDILALIEDELLLMIPFSPKHEHCIHKYQPIETELKAEKKDNPFDVLAALKKN